MAYVAGVDLGTTFTAAAVFGDDGALAVDLATQSMVIPSVVAVREDGQVLTGTTAERRLVLEPSRVAVEFKRRFGDATPLLLGGVPYGAETLSGLLLRSVVATIGERAGERPARVALSHPANYGDYKLDLLREEARIAEAGEVVLVPEPVAAAVHYAQGERVEVGALIAVYDLGGGTFDAAVVRRTSTGFELVGRPDGMERFGGIDMDEAVLGHVRDVLGEEFFDVDPADPAVLTSLARLREDCRRAKEALSGDTDVAIPVMLPGLHTEVRLTRAEFEDMIRPRIRETVDVLRRTVDSAGSTFGDVAAVLLVGGSSRIPLVGELVRQATGRPVAVDTHPKLTVALGAARIAHDAFSPATADRPPVPTATGAHDDQPRDAVVESGRSAGAADGTGRIPSEQGAGATGSGEPAGDDGGSPDGSGVRVGRVVAVVLVGALVLVTGVWLLRPGGDDAPRAVFDAGDGATGLELMAGGDYDSEVVSAGPQDEPARSSGGGRVLPSPDGNTDPDFYLQFDLDDEFVDAASSSFSATLEVEFLDDGTSALGLQYDAGAGGRYRDFEEVVPRAGSGEFVTATFELDDAVFTNGTGGGDFRLLDLSDEALVVRRLTVTLH